VHIASAVVKVGKKRAGIGINVVSAESGNKKEGQHLPVLRKGGEGNVSKSKQTIMKVRYNN
jgi:hypothetical protein